LNVVVSSKPLDASRLVDRGPSFYAQPYHADKVDIVVHCPTAVVAPLRKTLYVTPEGAMQTFNISFRDSGDCDVTVLLLICNESVHSGNMCVTVRERSPDHSSGT
jgi:hypothetical protein